MTLFNLEKNVINKPTRITAHSSTLLDPIIISDTMFSIYSDVLNVTSIEKVRVRVTCNHNVWINLKGHLDRML
jgi:hypothetical protein